MRQLNEMELSTINGGFSFKKFWKKFKKVVDVIYKVASAIVAAYKAIKPIFGSQGN